MKNNFLPSFFLTNKLGRQMVFFFYNDKIYKNGFFLEDLSNAHKIKINMKFDVISFSFFFPLEHEYA